MTRQTRIITHRGVTIERIAHSGMYVALVPGIGYVRAETVKCIRQMIGAALRGENMGYRA